MDEKLIAAFSNGLTKPSPRRFLKRTQPSNNNDDKNNIKMKKPDLSTEIDKTDPDFYLFNTKLSNAEKDVIRKSEYVYELEKKPVAKTKIDKNKYCPRCKNESNCPESFCYILDMEGNWIHPSIIELH